jgi:hypothetical protein
MKKGTKIMRAVSGALLFIMLSALQVNSQNGAQTAAREGLRKEIARAQELLYQGQYDAATSLFDEMSRKHETNPAGDFYKAVTLVWKSYVDARLETGSRLFDGETESLLASAIKKAEALKARADRSRDDEKDALYYLGSAHAIRSRTAFHKNNAIPAARSARAAQDLFNELLELDQNYWDAYYASGNIYYRVGLLTDSPIGRVATTMLGAKSLPKGDRERGLEYMKTAAEKGALARVDAKLALVEALTFNEQRLDDALKLARELQSGYPGNQTFARYVLKICAARKDRDGVTESARRILAQVREGKPNFGTFMKGEAERALAEARKY